MAGDDFAARFDAHRVLGLAVLDDTLDQRGIEDVCGFCHCRQPLSFPFLRPVYEFRCLVLTSVTRIGGSANA
jgi:hypothetical protein